MVANEPEPTLSELAASFVVAGPRQRHRIYPHLQRAVLADPAVADYLPLPWTLPASAPCFQVGSLKLLALRNRGDVEGLRKYVAAAPEGLALFGVGYTFGNWGDAVGKRNFAPVVALLLNNANPNVRYSALYFFTRMACDDKAELAPWADQLVRLASDGTRPPKMKEFVSSQARSALEFALTHTKRRPVFVTAAREWLAACDAKERRLFLKTARELLPEALT